MFKEINLRNHSSLHKLFYSLEDFDQLYTKHKLGVIHGTHPPLCHVHVDRAYNDDWLLFYFGADNKIYLSALGDHNLIEHISKIFND